MPDVYIAKDRYADGTLHTEKTIEKKDEEYKQKVIFNRNYYWELNSSYNRKFGDHSLGALLMFYLQSKSYSYKDGNNINSVINAIRYPYQSYTGVPYGIQRGLIALGLFKDWDDVHSSPKQNFESKVYPGDIKYKDMNKCRDLSETERRDVAGQCNFLLAHYYYCLVRQYGPVPLIPSTIPSNASVDAMSYPRATYDECIDFISKRYEEAASPWFNGNKYYVDFKRRLDGVNYFNQEYDAQKWGKAAKMYDNREMRFYASIVFNNCYRKASSYTGSAANNKNFYQTFYKDSPFAAWSDYPNDKSWSGYNCIKYCHPSDKPGSGGTTRSKYFPIIRYAEVLLNYVEAMNEMEGTYTDDVHNVTVSRNTAEMVKYFNMIRYRAGLPGITEADASDKAKMRELIKRERQVEFALEGRRFFDLRRWGDLASTMASPFTVLNVDARSNEQQKFYTRTISSYQYSLYNITNKMCLYPIKQTYLDKNAKLDQNPGWEK